MFSKSEKTPQEILEKEIARERALNKIKLTDACDMAIAWVHVCQNPDCTDVRNELENMIWQEVWECWGYGHRIDFNQLEQRVVFAHVDGRSISVSRNGGVFSWQSLSAGN